MHQLAYPYLLLKVYLAIKEKLIGADKNACYL